MFAQAAQGLALLVLLAQQPEQHVTNPLAGPRLDAVETVTIALDSRADLQWFLEHGFNVTNVYGEIAALSTTANERERLRDAGFSLRVVRPAPPDKGESDYHTYATLTTALQTFANDHPDIARLSSIGQSEQGRELWVLLISDNPDVEEDEPEFKYVSTMHGDEPVGTELCVDFIDRLLTSYGNDARITSLVDETAISIVPLMNPDGHTLIRRGNADGFDLNRSFPVFPTDYEDTFFDGEPLGNLGRPAEVAFVMQWSAANSFVLSANLHTGALLMNYPYDNIPGVPSGADAPTPDDLLFEEISLRYSQNNLPMFNSLAFEDGITNGSAWFSITGGMQDWLYRYLGCFDVTIELSNIKRPAAATLPQLIEDNREAMLVYAESVHLGVRGLATDRATGEPVLARVTVDGNAQPVFTDPNVGDYHRLLLPGAYRIRIGAPGYITYRASVDVGEGPAVRVDAPLSDGDLTGDGDVNAADVQAVVNEILTGAGACDCDVDGEGLSATDVQSVINRALELD